MKPASVLGLCVATTLLLSGSLGWAQDDTTAKAKMLFDVGAKAYEDGNYQAALQAFQQAYRVAPRPGIAFSIAQAHRRQYIIDKQPSHLHEAVKLYRDYLSRVPEGGRRSEVVSALAEIEPMVTQGGEETAAPEIKAQTMITVSSPIKEAMITLDGGKPVKDWLSAEVKPGKHKIQVSAAGYFPEEREVQAVEGAAIPLEVSLREIPANLSVRTEEGAQVSVDGRFVATTPLLTPIEVPSGRHVIALVKNGRKAHVDTMDFGRGEKKKVEVELVRTPRRTVSYVLMGAGLASGAAGVALGLMAAGAQGRAQEILDAANGQGNQTPTDLADYQTARRNRDAFGGAAIVLLGGAVATGGIGALLYLFDQPTVRIPGVQIEPAPAPSAPTPMKERSLEMSAAPIVIPGFYGASLSARF